MVKEMNETNNTALQIFGMKIDDSKLEKAVNNVYKKMESLNKGYLSIIGDVQYIIDTKAWEYTEYKNKYELFANVFGMSRGTVSNLENIFKRFGDKDTYRLKEESQELTVRDMLRIIAQEKQALLTYTSESEEIDDAEEAGEREGKETEAEETGAGEDSNTDLVHFDFTVGEDWSVNDLLAELTESIEKANVDNIKSGSHITLVIR